MNYPWLVWGMALSDGIIAFSYCLIPMFLFWILRRYQLPAQAWMIWCFAIFILSCGFGHGIDVWNLWGGAYLLTLVNRAITAIASLGTCMALGFVLRTLGQNTYGPEK